MSLSEHQLQCNVIKWARLQTCVFPELALLYAIPNGEKRHPSVAVRLKKEGVKAGVPDLHLPVSRGGYLGLWIEMKTATGTVRKNQKEIHAQLRAYGHRVVVCRSDEAAIDELRNYLRLEKEIPASTAH